MRNDATSSIQPFRGLFGKAIFAMTLGFMFPGASTAFAQDVATAEALFNRGLDEMKANHYDVACPAIAESYKADPSPGTLFTLAVCEMQWGHAATAAARFGDYLAVYDQLTTEQKKRQGKRYEEARKRRQQLEPRIPELVVTLGAGAPEGTVVKRNGVELGTATLGIGLPVDPGEHVFTTQAPGGQVSEHKITIGEGEKKSVTLTVEKPITPKPDNFPKPDLKTTTPDSPKPMTSNGPGNRRVAAYVTGGVGVAALGLGGVMGGLTLAKKSVITDHCGSGIGQQAEEACDSTGIAAANEAKSTALISTIGFGVGIVGVGIAMVLLVTEPKASKPKHGMVLPWRVGGYLDVGPDAAQSGLRGVF